MVSITNHLAEDFDPAVASAAFFTQPACAMVGAARTRAPTNAALKNTDLTCITLPHYVAFDFAGLWHSAVHNASHCQFLQRGGVDRFWRSPIFASVAGYDIVFTGGDEYALSFATGEPGSC